MCIRHPKVFYLDTDLGQSEFMPSGCVSLILADSMLLAHPFVHKSWKNVFSVFCGSFNPSDNPLFYMNAVKSIIEFYQSNPSIQDMNIPLVINTHGWIKSKFFASVSYIIMLF